MITVSGPGATMSPMAVKRLRRLWMGELAVV